ncbi:MAG TPA: C40 family peptidase [Ignavibacteriaceae bacterium]|nr:C40 family peptidase [Ignavibacteriaceae bacterium]
MNFYRIEKSLLFILFPVFILTGCSSSSNTIRYGSDENTEEVNEEPVRYGQNEVQETAVDTVSFEDEEVESDDTPDDLIPVDISLFGQNYNSESETSGMSSFREIMLMEIIKYMNTPYKFGGNSKEGIDCSAFTQTVYNSCSLQLLRSAREQFTQGIVIDKTEDLKFGDLVFFNTRKTVKPGHVGIYLGENLFVHASRKKGVIVTPITHEYYAKRFMGARRIEDSLDLQ